MTDKEKLNKLLTEFGVGFTEDLSSIDCEEGDNKIKGYSGFCATFNFDENGEFTEMGVWE